MFRGRKRLLLHHQCNRGGRPGCASRLDVDPAHSLPQQRPAGRNLIMVFFTVNYLHANLSAKHHRICAPHPLPHACQHRPRRRTYCAAVAVTCRKLLQKSTFAISRMSIATRNANADTSTTASALREKKSAPGMRRTPMQRPFPATRKAFCANTTRHSRCLRMPDDGNAGASSSVQCGATRDGNHWSPRAKATTKPDGRRIRKRPHKAAVSMHHTMTWVSGLRFPAARRSRPGRAGRSTVPARTIRRRTANHRRRHLR